jgi:hypothetical protein
MTKYFCICGFKTNSKKNRNDHLIDYANHVIFKRKMSTRFLNFVVDNHKVISRLLGIIMIYAAIIHHFDIQFNWWEGIALGLGFGLLP